MENGNKKGWSDLTYEVLITILMSLNVADIAAASMVCKTWNKACHDKSLWDKLDLSKLSSYCINIPNQIGAYQDSSTKMTQFLKYVLSLVNGNTTCIVFNYYVYLTGEMFIAVAERTPNLKRLVLPMAGDLSEAEVNMALKSWKCLESITVTSVVHRGYIFSAILKDCRSITRMKFTFCSFEEGDADAIIKHTPNMKELSIRAIMVSMKAMRRVLTSLEHLEAVNICHSRIMEKSSPRSQMVMYNTLDLSKHLPPSCIEKLIFCYERSCVTCMKERDGTTPSGRKNGFFEDIWREDEITSLAH